MDIYVIRSRLESTGEALLVVGVPEGVDAPPPALAGLDAALGGLLGRVLAAGDFRGILKETRLVYPPAPQQREPRERTWPRVGETPDDRHRVR